MITEVNATSPASLRAVFLFGQPLQVRIELDIELVGSREHPKDHLAEISRIIDVNRFHQRLDPACRECDWYQVLHLIRQCHEQAKLASSNLITSIRIEDGEGLVRELPSNMMLVESAAAKVM
jgi:hypothetical protein